MDTEKQKEVWDHFVEVHYSDKPRLRDLFKRSDIVETENGFEIRIPVVHPMQEEWLILYGLGETHSLIEQYSSEYPDLQKMSFAFIREDGTIVRLGSNWR